MSESEIRELITEASKKAFEFFQSVDYENAEEIYRQILRVEENNLDALEVGSLCLAYNGKSEEAKKWILKAISLDNNNYKFYNNLGLICGSLNEHEEAIRHFETAINISPAKSFLHTNLAIELKKSGDYERAVSLLEKALETHPNCEHVYFNYGAIIHEFGNIEKACELYQNALKVKYDFPACHYNLSACLFLLGDYERAWEEYEWRWKQFGHFAKLRERFSCPYWNGESLKNKTIVVYVEQGFGDLIMFSRFIPLLEGKVILECPAPLRELLSPLCETCEKFDGVADYNCSLMSVPRLLGIKSHNIPKSTLKAVGIRESEDWGRYASPKVGICWAGSPMHPNDKNRSCNLSNFKELPGTLFSFQKNTRPHVYPGVGIVDYVDCQLKVVDLSEYMTDFNKTAKMLEQMDYVVTVDTAVAHLAASIGKKAHVVLPRVPDWRWGISGNTTPWYDTMTLHRNVDDWASTFSRLRQHF